MIFHHYYLDCLSQGSYLVADTKTREAIVVDPRRDIDVYLEDADREGLRIVGIVNTHFHADFVAGHLELAALTGAWIGYGSRAEADYPIRLLHHGERVRLGHVDLEVLETPGHTWESICLVVREDDEPRLLLSGDTLFVGDVGRPDLAAAVGADPLELARAQYRSLHDVVLALPDEVGVHPAHGAGSACGRSLSAKPSSTIGDERRTNPALQPMSEDDFVDWLTTGQPPAPLYFAEDAVINRRLHPLLDPGTTPVLDAPRVRAALAAGAAVLDSRDPEEFARCHLPGAINVGIDGRFAETAGMVVSTARPVVVVASRGRGDEAALRLARVGFDDIVGVVADPSVLTALQDVCESSDRLDVEAFDEIAAAVPDVPPSPTVAAGRCSDVRPIVLDVRSTAEREAGAIPGSRHIPLAQLAGHHAELEPGVPVLVHCAAGWRSSVAASALRSWGHAEVADLRGGYAAWVRRHPAAVAS